jgi:hypothetical protein
MRKAWAHVTPEVMISERPAEVADVLFPAIGNLNGVVKLLE